MRFGSIHRSRRWAVGWQALKESEARLNGTMMRLEAELGIACDEVTYLKHQLVLKVRSAAREIERNMHRLHLLPHTRSLRAQARLRAWMRRYRRRR